MADTAERAAQRIISSNAAVPFKQSKPDKIESKVSSGKHTPVRPNHNLKKESDAIKINAGAAASLDANEDYR